MSWRRFLLVPQLVVRSIGAPRDPGKAWQRYWSSVADGEVLWDAGPGAEQESAAAALREHADLTLPLVDLGCGNGGQTAALTGLAPAVLGVDAAPAAVERAAAAVPGARFRVGDVTAPGFGAAMHAELGDCNAHVRGVLHVVPAGDRAAVVDNLAALLGARGTAYVCETDVRGDPLDYLRWQGVTATRMPPVVRRLVAAGVRAPSHFGPAEVAAHFPAARWRVLAAGPAVMAGVALREGGPPQEIPGYRAVIRSV